MANTADVRESLQVFLQKKASTRVKNTLNNIMPFFEFLTAKTGDKTGADGLGRPKSGLVISGVESAKARTERMFAERIYYPLVQTSNPTQGDEKSMTDYDNDPVASNWETESPLSRFTQPAFKFVRRKAPYKVPHSEVRTAKATAGNAEGQAAKAIQSVYDAEIKSRMAVHCQSWNEMLWGTHASFPLGRPTTETDNTWDCLFSIAEAIDDNNVYGGVDRALAANSWWRGNKITAATSAVFADIIDYCNYDLGMAAKGMGVDLIIVGAALFKIAKAEAKAEGYQMFSEGIPEWPEFGFKREVIRIFSGGRKVYVIYDPECPASHLAALNLNTWTLAVHPDSNFKISTPSDQTKNEGGDEADTGTIATEIMLCCEVPQMNAYFTNVS
jgi:hypothetical protein